MHDPKVIPVARILLDPQDIQQFLPRIVENLSLHRGLRLADEIDACIAGRKPDELLSIIVHAEHDPSLILATAILSIPTPTEVCHPISPDEHRKPNPPDTQPIRQAALPVRRLAEVLHAASFPNTSDYLISHASQLLKDRIKSELIKREIQQIRWITEPTNRGYPTQLGLMHLSTVQHMRLQMGRRHHENLGRENFNLGDSNDVMLSSQETSSPSRPHLHLQPVSWDSKEGLVEYFGLVEKTYSDSEDSPGFAAFNSSAQTLNDYRASPSFDPQGWFSLHESDQGKPIACIILSMPSRRTLELVYLGVIPSHRRTGIGRHALDLAITLACDKGVEQMVLAVDETNEAALQLYRQTGFQKTDRESVWMNEVQRIG